jgi:carbon-monoxide dehydrogenase medium subunit
MVARSARGARIITEPGFFQGMMSTALAPDEMLVETRMPLLGADTRCGFNEFNRRAGDFAIAMALATYRLDNNGRITEPHLGVGAVEDSPRRIAEAEAVLAGVRPSTTAFAAAAEAAALAVEPIEQDAALAAYKRDVVRAVVRRALEMAETSR